MINLLGAEAASGIETILVVALLGIIVAMIALGWGQMEPVNLRPLVLPGRSPRDVLVVAGLVFVSFGGLVNVTSVAEEVKRPATIIPAATISSVVVITILYALLIRTAVGVAGPERIAGASNPIANAARLIAGTPGFVAVTVGAILAFVTTAIAGLLSASRYPLALARDGLAPAALGGVSRRGIPIAGVLLTSAVMIGALALDLRLLIEAASVVIALNYLLSNVSVIVMRASGLVGYRPGFRVPLYPVIPILAIVAYAVLIIDLGWEAIVISLGFVAASLIVYLIWGRRADAKEYALQHLVERLTSRDLTGDDLEGELREIVHESRGIVTDRFDELVQESICIDLPEATRLDELFRGVAERVHESVGLTAGHVTAKLTAREADSSTALSTFVAVPHIVMPGSNRFQLVLVRCARGVDFGETAPAVQAVFVLMGTADERNFHLRALTAIAQICQDETFDDAWLAVRKENQLRDLVLLRSRRRTG